MATSGTTVSGALRTNTINEYTSNAGVTIDGTLIKDNAIAIDTVNEKTSTNGVTVQGVNIMAPVAAPNTAQLTAGTSVLSLDRTITTISDDTTLGDPTPSANIIPTQNAVYSSVKEAGNLKLWVFTHDEPSGTGGGSLVAGAWTQMVLNTTKHSHSTCVTLASNQLTCCCGNYDFDCNCIRVGAERFRMRIYDVTNATALAYSTSNAQTVPVTTYTFEATMHVYLEFAVDTVIQFEYWSSDAVATIGLGRPTTIPGVEEQYLRVVINKDNCWM
jgi:hypothetical protein